MALRVIEHDNRFRVESQSFCTSWLSDTSANRKAMLVFLRLLSDSNGQALFTHQQLAQIVKSSNRQACSHHVETFVACGSDFLGDHSVDRFQYHCPQPFQRILSGHPRNFPRPGSLAGIAWIHAGTEIPATHPSGIDRKISVAAAAKGSQMLGRSVRHGCHGNFICGFL